MANTKVFIQSPSIEVLETCNKYVNANSTTVRSKRLVVEQLVDEDLFLDSCSKVHESLPMEPSREF